MIAGSLTYKLAVDSAAFDSGLRQADRDADRAGQRSSEKFKSRFEAGVGNFKVNIDGPIGRSLNKAEGLVKSSFGRMGSIMTGIFQGVGMQLTNILTSSITGAVSFGVGKLKELGAFVYDIGSKAANTRIAFQTMIGDAQKANSLLADMRKFSAATPYTGQEVQSAAQGLLTVVKPEQMISTLQRLGNVASGVQKPLSELTLVYQQVLSKGKLQGEEMLQFAEKGIPIYKAVADVLGVNVSQVSKLTSEGRLSSDVMVAAFEKMSEKGGQFYGMMDKQSKTVSGQISTIQDGFEQAAEIVYQKMEPALNAVLKTLVNSVDKAMKQQTIMDSIGKLSNDIATFLNKHPAIFDKITAAAVKLLDTGMKQIVKQAESFLKYLEQNPQAVDELLAGIKDVATQFGEVLNLVAEISKAIMSLVEPANQLANSLNGAMGWAQNAGTATRNFFMGNDSVNAGKYDARNPNGTRATDYAHSTAHHDKQSGPRGVIKDVTLWKNGRSDVDFPSLVSGKVKKTVTGNANVRNPNAGGGYGNYVIVEMPNGKEVLVAHLKAVNVKEGDMVKRGQSIGIQGTSGNSTGTHGHIEDQKEVVSAFYDSLRTGNWGENSANPNGKGGGVGGYGAGRSNRERFLGAIRVGENSGSYGLAPNGIGARGAYQFTPGTRAMVKKQTGVDAWSKDPREQDRAAGKLIDLYDKSAWNNIDNGDFIGASRKLRTQWTSLPGAKEQSPYWNHHNINNYGMAAGGQSGTKYNFYLEQEESDDKKANEAKKTQREQERRAKTEQREEHRKQTAEARAETKKQKEAARAKEKADAETAKAKKKAQELAEDNAKLLDEQNEKQQALNKEVDEIQADMAHVSDKSNRVESVNQQFDSKFSALNDLYEKQKSLLYDAKTPELKAQAAGGLKTLDAMRSMMEADKQRQVLLAQSEDSHDVIVNKLQKQLDLEEAQNQALEERKAALKDVGDRVARAMDAAYTTSDNRFAADQSIAQGKLDIQSARSSLGSDPYKQASQQKQIAGMQIGLDLSNSLRDIEKMGRTGEYTANQLAAMKQNAQDLAQVKMEGLNGQFQTLGQTISNTVSGAFSGFLQNVISGSQSAEDALLDMVGSLASSILSMGLQSLMGGIFGGAGGSGGLLSGLFGFANGTLNNYATGGTVGEAMNRERVQSGGRSPVLAVLNKDEVVLSAKQAKSMFSGQHRVPNFAEGTTHNGVAAPTANNMNGVNISMNIPVMVQGGGDVDTVALQKDLDKNTRRIVEETINKHMGSGGAFRTNRRMS